MLAILFGLSVKQSLRRQPMSDILFPLLSFCCNFTNNILLTNYLGMCSFLSVSKELETSAGLGIAVTFVMAVTTALNWLVYEFLLVLLNSNICDSLFL